MSTPGLDGFLVLSNDDVRLLFEIVEHAEDAAGPPFRALNAAYARVLEDHGIRQERDQKFFRFILRLGERCKRSGRMFDHFRNLLLELGIQVDLDGDAVESLDSSVPDEARPPARVRPEGRMMTSGPTYPTIPIFRRLSFDTVDSTGNWKAKVKRDLYLAHPARSRSADLVRRSLKKDPNVAAGPQRITVPTPWLSETYTSPPSVEHEKEAALPEHSNQINVSTENLSETAGINRRTAAEHSAGFPRELNFSDTIDEPSQIQMLADAKSLKFHHTAARCLNIFRQWSAKARPMQIFQEQMQHDAADLWTSGLLQRHLRIWYRSLQQRTKSQESCYKHIENQAAEARDKYLLTKALTHWAGYASEEYMRTAAARRHLLRNRYFKAWREATLLVQKRARNAALARFLIQWRNRAAIQVQMHKAAADSNQRGLLHHSYRHWFWRFCERRAPLWRVSNRLSVLFQKWIGLSIELQDMHIRALDFEAFWSKRQVALGWIVQSQAISSNQQRAVEFRCTRLLRVTMVLLRSQFRLSGARKKMASSIDSRVIQQCLRAWRRRATDISIAVQINAQRIARNTWTTWNDRLRCQALTQRIDERVILQTLYAWALCEREKVFTRSRVSRLGAQFMAQWRHKTDDLCASLGLAKRYTQSDRSSIHAHKALSVWSSKMQYYRDEGHRTEIFRNGRLLKITFQAWSVKVRRKLQQCQWAIDARFYVLTTRTIQHWQCSVAGSRRAKRRSAYASIKDHKRKRLISACFSRWYRFMVSLTELKGLSEDALKRTSQKIAVRCLDSWYNANWSRVDLDGKCATFRSRTLLNSGFVRLKQYNELLAEAKLTARNFLLFSKERVAAEFFRKLNWRVFQLKRQQESSEYLLERNRKKHYKNMIRCWHEQALAVHESLESPHHTQNQQGEVRPFSDIKEHAVSSDLATWPANILLSTPKYLRTPTRRPVASRLQGPTAPATSQITPFMQKLKAAQSGNTSVRFGMVASERQKRNMFKIPETSPISYET